MTNCNNTGETKVFCNFKNIQAHYSEKLHSLECLQVHRFRQNLANQEHTLDIQHLQEPVADVSSYTRSLATHVVA
jgi:hypothetical protein